ncbi:MAG TPA: adenylosuccinate synthetase [Candidatus Rubrimentiphilum sp.]|nr:adenylosuccinate synthetase [Candidatus Rubrimentiphilum sp.]
MVDIIVGLQFGDEGKGRIVDYYAADYDIIARFGGGDNAGHTIRVGEQKLALRIVPSGVLREQCELFIGGGTVVSLEGLAAELAALRKLGIDTARIKVSDRAHVVFPRHAEADKKAEQERGAAAIGTTGRGIGPAYVDKVARSGVTLGDLVGKDDPSIARVRAHVVDGVQYLHDALARGARVLAEGAQGTLLDVGYGTYPYVTSSHTLAGGACVGLGIGPNAIGRVTGVVKAYATRVGAGPFPSELHDANGERLREAGGEFGTVTGRPRRCGWYDGVAAQYAVMLNGLSAAAITKLDVLSGFERIGIVTGYRIDGKTVTFAQSGAPKLHVDVEYVDGWSEDISGVRKIAQLPAAARADVAHIEENLGVRVECVSVGPERSQLAV